MYHVQATSNVVQRTMYMYMYMVHCRRLCSFSTFCSLLFLFLVLLFKLTRLHNFFSRVMTLSFALTRFLLVLGLLVDMVLSLPPNTNAHLAATFPRKGAVFDPAYAKKLTYRAKGKDEHKAQFKEDIIMYEKYFFGMKDGVIMESGALDGDLYSTSFMFEKHFNWKSIHIGEQHVL